MSDSEDTSSAPQRPALIPNSRLRVEHLPAANASDEEVFRFALTFNGYRNFRSFERSAFLYHEGPGTTLSTLRNWLFFHTRQIYYSWGGAVEEDFTLMRSVIEEIRELLIHRDQSGEQPGR